PIPSPRQAGSTARLVTWTSSTTTQRQRYPTTGEVPSAASPRFARATHNPATWFRSSAWRKACRDHGVLKDARSISSTASRSPASMGSILTSGTLPSLPRELRFRWPHVEGHEASRVGRLAALEGRGGQVPDRDRRGQPEIGGRQMGPPSQDLAEDRPEATDRVAHEDHPAGPPVAPRLRPGRPR